MAHAVSSTCAQHAERRDCPDALVSYLACFDEYGLIVHDGGSSVVSITYCPWCGAALPESKRGRWFEELERLGYDACSEDLPAAYRSDVWWRLGAAPRE